MNISEINKAIPFLLKNRIVPFFWGSQGVGKTQFWNQYCAKNNLQLRVLHTATQDVGDLVGLLVKGDDGGVYHAKPKWFPTEGEGVIFLDELNRAPTDVIQAMYSFVQNGTIHTHKLPPGWRIAAAGNYQSERFTTTDTSDSAWLSRFCHIDFTPTTEEWLVYAESRGLFSLASFIREQPEMLNLTAKEGGRLDMSIITRDPRAWLESVGALDLEEGLDDSLRYELYSGIVGPVAAAARLTHRAKQETGLSLNDILKNYKKIARNKVLDITASASNVRMDVLNQPIDELFTKLESNPHLLSADMSIDNLKQFLLDIPIELAMKAFVGLGKIGNFHGKNDLLNDPDYAAQFEKA